MQLQHKHDTNNLSIGKRYRDVCNVKMSIVAGVSEINTDLSRNNCEDLLPSST